MDWEASSWSASSWSDVSLNKSAESVHNDSAETPTSSPSPKSSWCSSADASAHDPDAPLSTLALELAVTVLAVAVLTPMTEAVPVEMEGAPPLYRACPPDAAGTTGATLVEARTLSATRLGGASSRSTVVIVIYSDRCSKAACMNLAVLVRANFVNC
jgi:hypothetical protein